MNQINKIYDEFFKIEPDDKSQIIKFYEENQLTLDNKNGFTDIDDFKDYMIILSQYIISLEKQGKYSKAILFSDKALNMILENFESYEIELNNYNAYWSALTSKGRAHYNLKEYDKAISCFDKLVEWDAENDNFRNWLIASRHNKRNSINKYLYISATFLILTVLAIGDNVLDKEIKLLLLKLAILLYAAAFINEYFYDRIIEWIKK